MSVFVKASGGGGSKASSRTVASTGGGSKPFRGHSSSGIKHGTSGRKMSDGRYKLDALDSQDPLPEYEALMPEDIEELDEEPTDSFGQEGPLPQSMSHLRSLLGDDASGPAPIVADTSEGDIYSEAGSDAMFRQPREIETPGGTPNQREWKKIQGARDRTHSRPRRFGTGVRDQQGNIKHDPGRDVRDDRLAAILRDILEQGYWDRPDGFNNVYRSGRGDSDQINQFLENTNRDKTQWETKRTKGPRWMRE
jgi:hypothetical protein